MGSSGGQARAWVLSVLIPAKLPSMRTRWSRNGRTASLRDVVEEPFGQPSVRPFGTKARLTFDPPQLGQKRAVRLTRAFALDRSTHDPFIAVTANRCGAELVC